MLEQDLEGAPLHAADIDTERLGGQAPPDQPDGDDTENDPQGFLE